MGVAALRRRLNGTWTERAGRFGLGARGVLYTVIGILALQLALGDYSQRPDKSGALAAIADQPLGRVLLAILALGFGGYAAWRFAQAVFDRGDDGDGLAALVKRAGYFVRGLWYAAVAAFAATRVFMADEPTGSGEERRLATDVMSLPFGRALVAAAGLAFLGAAAYNGYRAATLGFESRLRRGRMSKAERRAAKGVGVLGHVARLGMFGLIGAFLAKAAWEYDPDEARGLDDALAELSGEPFGSVAIGALAVGLIAYGLYEFVEARYRDV